MPDLKNSENQALRRIIELALGKVRDDLEKSKEKLETETCKKLLQKLRTESPKQCHELLVAFIKRKLSFDTTKDGLVEYCESIQHKSGCIGRDPNGEGDFVKAFFEYKSCVAAPAVSHSSPQGNAVTDPTNGRQSRSSHQGASPSGTQPSNTTAASSAPCGQKDFEQLFSKVILRLRDDGVLGPDMDIELLDPLLAKELADTYSAHTDRSQTSGLFNKWLYQMDKHNSQDGHELCEAVLLVLQHWYQHAPSKVPLSWSTVKAFIDAYTEEARRDDLDPEFQVQVVFETGEVCTFPEYCRKQNPDANNSAGVSVDRSTSDQLPVATGSDQDAHGDTDDELYSNGPDALKPVPQSANVETSTTVSISHPTTSAGSTAQSSSVSTAGNTVNQPTTSTPQVAVPATHGSSTASKTTAFAASIPGLATLDGKPPPAQAPKIPTGASPATRATASTLTGGISTAGANTATSTQNPTVTSPLPIQSAIRRTAIVSMWSTPSTPIVSNQSSIGSSYGDTDMTDPVASAAQPTKDGDVDMKDLEGSGQQAAPIRHLDGDVDMKDLEVSRQKATTRPSDGDADMEDLEGPRQKAAPTGSSDGDVDMKDPEGPRQKAAPTQSSDGDVNMKDPEGPLQEATTLPSDDDVAMIDPMAPAATISDGSAPSIQSAGNQPSQNSPQPQSARATDLSPSPRKEISVFQISRNKNLRARKRHYGKGTQPQPSSPTSTRRTSSHSDTVLDEVSRIHKPYHFHWDRRRVYNKRSDVQQSDTDDEASRVPHGGDSDSADAAVEQIVDVPAQGNPAAELTEPGQQVPNLPPDEADQERDVSTVEAEDTQASTESVASSKPSGTPDVQAQLGEDQPEAPVVHKQASLAEAPVQEEVLSGTKPEPTPTTFNTMQGDTSVDSTENATTYFCEKASVPTEAANLQIAAEYQASSPVTNEPGVAISSPDHGHDQSSVGSSPGHLLRFERLAGSGYRHTFHARGRPVTWIDYPPVTVPEPRNDVSPAQFSLGYYSARQRMNMDSGTKKTVPLVEDPVPVHQDEQAQAVDEDEHIEIPIPDSPSANVPVDAQPVHSDVSNNQDGAPAPANQEPTPPVVSEDATEDIDLPNHSHGNMSWTPFAFEVLVILLVALGLGFFRSFLFVCQKLQFLLGNGLIPMGTVVCTHAPNLLAPIWNRAVPILTRAHGAILDTATTVWNSYRPAQPSEHTQLSSPPKTKQHEPHWSVQAIIYDQHPFRMRMPVATYPSSLSAAPTQTQRGFACYPHPFAARSHYHTHQFGAIKPYVSRAADPWRSIRDSSLWDEPVPTPTPIFS